MTTQQTHTWVNRFAVLTAVATVVLIVAGATVTSTGSGDAVPDWPLSYGTLFPRMVGGVLYEHTHRMVAGVTGVLIMILAVWLWRWEPRRWVRWLGLAVAMAVVAQAVLGGLRVLIVSQPPVQEAALGVTGMIHVTPVRIAFSVTHAALAQIVLCLVFALATITSARWRTGVDSAPDHVPHDTSRISRLAFLVIVLVFAQLLIGALMRHMGAGLAIPDFPLSFGRLLPPFDNLPYNPNAPFQVPYDEVKTRVVIHFAHRVGALIVALAIMYLTWRLFRYHRKERRLVRLGAVLLGLLVAQLTLGASVIWTKKAVPITVLHVAVGASLLGTGVVLWLWATRRERAGSSEYAKPATKGGLGKSLSDYIELTKPRITFLVLVTTLAGFYLGSRGSLNLLLLLHTFIATGLVASGTNALNMLLERDVDSKMLRTKNRPLPAGRLQPNSALYFGIIISLAGILYLAFVVNPLTGLLSATALSSYLFLYTPLKRKTSLCTVVGSISGAIPPMMGWTAVRNEISPEAVVLFSILFLWQIPHFFAIAWLYREDYARAGFPMLPVLDPMGTRTGRQIIAYSFALLLVSLLPTILGLSGPVYLFAALLLGLLFLGLGVCFNTFKSNLYARRFFLASVVYLPVLLVIMVIDKVNSV